MCTVVAVASGCGQGSGDQGSTWEPDDGLQRAQRALDADDTETDVVESASAYVGSGLDRTFDTPGDKPYRFDIVCDSFDVSPLTLTVTRDGPRGSWTSAAGTGGPYA
ncbi:hypothetical protein [Streptomyces sp. NPDC058279]|uniref:hypothetical protein n=1 Tax=Streptomyces sp. NPDC058279 TaxID=3346418 RepID=UPI0036E5EB79